MKRGLLFGEAFGTDEVGAQLLQVDAHVARRTIEYAVEFGGSEAVLGGAGAPATLGDVAVDVRFVVARLPLDLLDAALRDPPPGGGQLHDLGMPLREVVENFLRDALDLRGAIADLLPLDAEGARQLVPEDCFADGAGGLRGGVDGSHVGSGPATIGGANAVGDDHVRVQMRVAGASHLVRVHAADEPLRADDVDSIGASASEAFMPLEVVESGADRALLGGEDLLAQLLVPDREQHTDGLRCGERQVESGVGRTAPTPSW